MHTLFIYNYLQICKTQTVPFQRHSSSSGPSSLSAGLVDPRQLLHYLNDLVHCGFTLHAAAVIDL